MWSLVVFEPALPGRSDPARNSPLLSHQTPIGWYPNVFLNVRVACSFSLCATTIVASTSSTTTSAGRVVPATFEAGRPPGTRPHTRARVPPRRLDPLQRLRADPSKARHTVGADATAPSTSWLVTQGVDIGDRFPTSGDHRGHIDQDPTAVVAR